MHCAWSHFALYRLFQEESPILRGERTYYYCTKFIVSEYKCSHIVKTSDLIDGTYGEKYKMAQSIFCVGFKPITATSFCCLSTDCLLIRHIP